MPPGTAIFGRLPPDREDRDILNKIEIIGHVTVIFGFYTVFGADRIGSHCNTVVAFAFVREVACVRTEIADLRGELAASEARF